MNEWSPGEAVEIVANRIRLRSLRPSDVKGHETPAWYGEAERRRYLWAPDMPTSDFLRGLARASDNKNYFVLLACRLPGGEPVGLAKGQVMVEGRARVFVLTTVLGHVRDESLTLGYEISAATLYFATTQLAIDAISLRIYADNRTVAEMAKMRGYRLVATYDEKSTTGSRSVLDFRKTKQQWQDDNAARYAHFRVGRPNPSA